MNLRSYFLGLMMMATMGAMAVGNEGVVTAKSTNTKMQLTIKVLDVEPGVSDVQLTMADGAPVHLTGYDPATIIDLPNHILTICFTQKANPADKPVKIWALPTSFVKIAGSENSWRFKVKITGGPMRDVTTLDATYEWKP